MLTCPLGRARPGRYGSTSIELSDRNGDMNYSFGADIALRSGIDLRGDEANLLNQTDTYAILKLHGTFRWSEQVKLFARIENAFDEGYAAFGRLGEPNEVVEGLEDLRFFRAAPPFGTWVGIHVNF